MKIPATLSFVSLIVINLKREMINSRAPPIPRLRETRTIRARSVRVMNNENLIGIGTRRRGWETRFPSLFEKEASRVIDLRVPVLRRYPFAVSSEKVITVEAIEEERELN